MARRAEILSIGTELLLGEVTDTNATYLSQKMAEIGINVYHKQTVGDNWTRMAGAIGLALSRTDLLLISGGLGPTEDDITKDVVAAVCGRPLALHEESLRRIERFFTQTGRTLSPSNRRQAMLPQGAEALPNDVGTAPGVWLKTDPGPIIVCLPGVPRELRAMLEGEVIPRLTAGEDRLYSRVLRFLGMAESDLADRLGDLLDGRTGPTYALYAETGEVRLRLTVRAASEAEASSVFDPVEHEVRAKVGHALYGRDADTPASIVGRLLRQGGHSVATAESCTGGLVAHLLTNVAGSSSYVLGGVVAYDNAVKESLLGVSRADLQTHGAVSEPVAIAMAQGVRRALGTDYGIGITGIAGPGGGTESKPVGTVFIAWSGPQGDSALHRVFGGAREAVKERSALAALDGLRRILLQSQSEASPRGE